MIWNILLILISGLGDDIDARTASQNALLKSLLANMAGGRPPGTPFSEVRDLSAFNCSFDS